MTSSFLARAMAAAACLASVALAQQTRDPLPVPDVGAYRTLKCDFHLHTVFSDGEVWPTTRVVEAWRDGLDAIAITDHTNYNPHQQDVPVDLARPHAIARGTAAQLGLILIPAVELGEGNLHANALFVKDANAFIGLTQLSALTKRAREQDAFVFWNHPGWKGTAEWFPIIAAAHADKGIQGIELVNGLSFYPEAYPWVNEKSLTILSNSDIHAPISPQYAPRQRPVTLVFAKTADLDGIREALLNRRTAAWMGGQLWGSEEILRGLWAGAVKSPEREFSITGSNRAIRLDFHNVSAIPFNARVTKAPAWLSFRAAEIRNEKVVAWAGTVAKNAPAGRNAVEVELELTNLHVEPGRNAKVTLPMVIHVGQ